MAQSEGKRFGGMTTSSCSFVGFAVAQTISLKTIVFLEETLARAVVMEAVGLVRANCCCVVHTVRSTTCKHANTTRCRMVHLVLVMISPGLVPNLRIVHDSNGGVGSPEEEEWRTSLLRYNCTVRIACRLCVEGRTENFHSK